MSQVYCIECSAAKNAYVRHEWPPCDLNADGTTKEPLPCGHRRPCRCEDGKCRECERKKGK